MHDPGPSGERLQDAAARRGGAAQRRPYEQKLLVWSQAFDQFLQETECLGERRGLSPPDESEPGGDKPRRSPLVMDSVEGTIRMQADGTINVAELVNGLLNRAERVVVGQRDSLEMVMLALLCGGHVLLEGVPGTAKTLMARTLARLLALDCKRVQFTPDLMPSDIVGTNVFNLQSSQFEFRAGPVFTDILVADEINRTPPKTQSALLEVMEEKTVTIDGISHPSIRIVHGDRHAEPD